MKKELSFKQGIIPVIIMAILIIMSVLVWKVPIHLALFLQLTVTILLALSWGFKWQEIETMLFSSFKNIGNVIIILLLIGMLIGVWIASGTVPSMIYYGLKVLNPRYFLVLSFVLTTFVSMAVGTAFGTASTIGLALISIAQGVGLPLNVVSGAIISGSYIGDRMSPVSSIAIITAHSADVKVIEMIKHMVYTTIPPFILSFIIYLIMGWKIMPIKIEAEQITLLMGGLSEYFLISYWLLLPPIAIILLAVLRIPTILNLIINIFISMAFSLFVSGKGWVELLNVMYTGMDMNTGIKVLDNILARGGLMSMMEIVALIIFAVTLGGLMEELGVLKSILGKMIKTIHNRGQLILITMISSIISAMLGCNQFMAVYLPGKMMGSKFDEMRVPRKDLARALGDSGLIISPLIPWNLNALLMTGILGVSTLSYLPYSFLPLLLPISGVVLGFISKSKKVNKNENN